MTVSSYTTHNMDQTAQNNTLYIRRMYVPILSYVCIYFVSFILICLGTLTALSMLGQTEIPYVACLFTSHYVST